MVYMVGILVLIIPISKVVLTLITLLKFILKNYYSRSRSSRSHNSHRRNVWGSVFVMNTGQSSQYVQFLRRQRSEHQLSSSWSTTLGHLGQIIEECILPPHPLQVCCCAESWKDCRHAAQLTSSAIKNRIFFFKPPSFDFFRSLPPTPAPALARIVRMPGI